jgi:hypothetical protein
VEYKVFRKPVRGRDGSLWLSDLYAAAFLTARGHRVDRVEPTAQAGRLCFVFSADDGLDADYRGYCDNAEVGARAFVAAIYSLKEILGKAVAKT